MNTRLAKQINSELHKTYRALHWNMKPGRRNPYKSMMVSDTKALNRVYKLLLEGKDNAAFDVACTIDMSALSEMPARIRHHLCF
jgi:hypothetical protein